MIKKITLLLTILFLILFSSLYAQTGEWSYYVRDHLGNTRVVLDENGNVKEYYNYHPYGMQIDTASEASGNNPAIYKLTGKELDDEADLDWYYFGARYYDPDVGRWLTPDPLAQKYPGLSPYVYCHNNPVNRFDPDGTEDWWAAAKASWRIFKGGSAWLFGAKLCASMPVTVPASGGLLLLKLINHQIFQDQW